MDLSLGEHHADAFIRRNQNRRPKTMRTDNPEGPPVRKVVLKDYSRQYNYLLKVAITAFLTFKSSL